MKPPLPPDRIAAIRKRVREWAEIYGAPPLPIFIDYRTLPPQRGFVVLYRPGEPNACPGCGGRSWHVGRQSAECARCHTAIPLMSPVMPGIITQGEY